MHSIHLPDVHVPKGPNLWLLSASATAFFLISMVLFLMLSFAVGDGFRESMGGDVGFGILIGGLIVSTIFAIVEKPGKSKQSGAM